MLKVRKFFFVSLMFHLLFTFVHTGFVLSVYTGSLNEYTGQGRGKWTSRKQSELLRIAE